MSTYSFRLVAFIGFGLAAITLRAQTVSGTILGVIQDQQGAVVAKANVSTRNLETGAVREAIAGDNGRVSNHQHSCRIVRS